MKAACVVPLVLLLTLGGCAHPLETVSLHNHQVRMDADNANLPITSGAADQFGRMSPPPPANLSVSSAHEIQKAMNP